MRAGPTGVTPNDTGDGDTGPNDLQNFPVITSADPSTQTISGTLNSNPSVNGYRIEFFKNPTCDPAGNGEGMTFIGSTTVNTDGSGNASFTFIAPPATFVAGDVITATATDPLNSTSEFSMCSAAAVPTPTPTPTYADTNSNPDAHTNADSYANADSDCAPFSTVYVDDSWVGTTPFTDPDAGGPATSFGCDSFATIQGGVNGVTAGGTVNVLDGLYRENVTIPKALTPQWRERSDALPCSRPFRIRTAAGPAAVRSALAAATSSSSRRATSSSPA